MGILQKRLARWLLAPVIALLVVIGMVASVNFFVGQPGVGHFRSATGQDIYTGAYADAMDAMPEPTTTHDVPTSHGVIRVYEWEGDDEEIPILLAPGRASGVPMWSENLPLLVGHRRILAFDLLGDAGLSIQSAPFHSFAEQAEPIDEVVNTLAPEGVHLVGHSFGGAVATAYAQHFPDRVLSLTLLEPAFVFAYPPLGQLWWSVVASLPFIPEGARERALEGIGGADAEATTFEQDPVAAMIAAATEHFSAALPQPVPLDEDARAMLRMPIYVAIASDDSLAGGQRAVDRAQDLSDVKIEVWPNTTHSLPMQAAGEIEAVLLDFFDSVDGV